MCTNLLVISELHFASVSKQGLMQNFSYGEEFDLQENATKQIFVTTVSSHKTRFDTEAKRNSEMGCWKNCNSKKPEVCHFFFG